jgi:hypothetical protein
MKKQVHAVGDSIEMMCSACDIMQMHRVEATTKQGVVTSAVCEACETSSTFTRGVKTAVSVGRGKNASPYDRMRTYRKGQAMTHDTFGRGEVTAVLDRQKIDVLFSDKTRRLIHAQR